MLDVAIKAVLKRKEIELKIELSHTVVVDLFNSNHTSATNQDK